MRYGIQWDIVAAIPLIAGLLLADHLGQGRKKRKTAEEPKVEKTEVKEAKKGAAPLIKKRRSGFRRMKSNAQRIRDRTKRMEEAAASAGIEMEELHEAMEEYAASLRPHQMYKPKI